jgi:hypothetical protein
VSRQINQINQWRKKKSKVAEKKSEEAKND